MKLISTEIDEATIQLTYSDGSPEDDAKELILIRFSNKGSSNKSLNRLQSDALQRAYAWIDGELTRLQAAMADGR